MKNFFFAVLVALLFACANPSRQAKLSGPYLGQALPGDAPVLFAPGVVSTGMYTRDLAMTPDGNEIYYCVVLGQFRYSAIMVTRQVNGVWTDPEVAPFSGHTDWMDLEPCISHDGQHFYFMSNRPDTAAGDTSGGDEDIWVMDRQGDGWGEPYNLGAPVNSENEEYFPSITRDGTLYFTRQTVGSPIGFIYRSRLVDGRYTKPVKLPEQVNSGRTQYNACVAPDESYLIVPVWGREDSYGATDYYIVYRDEQDNWSEPVHLDERVNSADRNEYSPYITHDGKFFFFMSGRDTGAQVPDRLTADWIRHQYTSPGNGNPSIWWVSTEIFKE